MAENNTATALGIIILILSLVSLFVWNHNYRIYMILYGIGAALFCISGLLFLIGGYQNKVNVVGTGFGLGMPGWALILISCILGISWNQSGLAMTDITTLIVLVYLHENINTIDLYTLITFLDFFLSISSGGRAYRIGYFGSIIHIPFAIAGLILGILALRSVQSEKW
ncbi:MAG: hypothetical protein ACFFCM_07550 [Promethearchaeota archaeon]